MGKYSLRMLGARVLVEPEAGQVRQVAQVSNLVQVADLVLPNVQLAQPPAPREVAQGPDLVYTGTHSPIFYTNSRSPIDVTVHNRVPNSNCVRT